MGRLRRLHRQPETKADRRAQDALQANVRGVGTTPRELHRLDGLLPIKYIPAYD